MTSESALTTRICHLSLRVRDLKRSVAFYCELFGAVVVSSEALEGNVQLRILPVDPLCSGFGIMLVEVLPNGVELFGLDHFGLEVPGESEVQTLFLAAIARGANATEPRVFNGHFQTFIFDPDGYKIEVLVA